MKFARIVTTLFVMILLTTLSGCSSKKETSDQAPPQKADLANPSSHKGDAVEASPQDEADASMLKASVLAHVKVGDYTSIYKEASTGFRAVGTEGQFLAMWQNQLQETGAFTDAKEISHKVRPQDKFLVYIYDVKYEKMHKALRLTFGRSKKGVMELTGINQTELPKAAK